MNRRQQRQRNRADRRMQYAGLRAEFLLAGGHKDWLVPFSHAWLTQMQQQIASIAKGDPYFTKPRNGRYTTGYIDEYSSFPQKLWPHLPADTR